MFQVTHHCLALICFIEKKVSWHQGPKSQEKRSVLQVKKVRLSFLLDHNACASFALTKLSFIWCLHDLRSFRTAADVFRYVLFLLYQYLKHGNIQLGEDPPTQKGRRNRNER
jgi:hypothetical protein